MSTFDVLNTNDAPSDPLLHAVVAMQTHARQVAELYKLDIQPVTPGYDDVLCAVSSHYQIDMSTLVDFIETQQPPLAKLTAFIAIHSPIYSSTKEGK